MSTSTTRRFTLSRVVTLGLIALLVAGLTYLRFAPGSGSISVPEGAKAGDLILQPCDYATENGSSAADCGTLVVPENRADEQSRLIALLVIRIPARSNHPAEPIFILQGGPGHSNMTLDKVSRYTDERDVVLVGYTANTTAKCKYSGADRLAIYFAADSGRDDAAVGQGGWSSNSQGEYSFQTSQLTTTHSINSADPPTARRPPTDITNALRSLLIVLPPCVVPVRRALGDDPDDRRRHSRVVRGGGRCGA